MKYIIRYIIKRPTVTGSKREGICCWADAKLENIPLQAMLEKKEFEKLYTANYMDMIRFARTLLHDEDESRDVVADVMLRVYTKGIPDQYVPVKYLLACVRNKCLDVLRQMTIRQKMERMLPVEDVGTPVSQSGASSLQVSPSREY